MLTGYQPQQLLRDVHFSDKAARRRSNTPRSGRKRSRPVLRIFAWRSNMTAKRVDEPVVKNEPSYALQGSSWSGSPVSAARRPSDPSAGRERMRLSALTSLMAVLD